MTKAARGLSFARILVVLTLAWATPALADRFTVLHVFDKTPNDGVLPGPLALGDGGVIYGTTTAGGRDKNRGRHGNGTIFRLDPNGTMRLLHTSKFESASGDPVLKNHMFYASGSDGGNGTVYAIKRNGTKFRYLHMFGEGVYLTSQISFDDRGNIYGGVAYSASQTSNSGELFKLTPGGTVDVLYQLPGTNVFLLSQIRDRDGNFIGVESFGYNSAIFYYQPRSHVFSVLHNGTDDIFTIAGIDQAGNVYGYSRATNDPVSGTLFEMTKTSSGYAYALLSSITTKTQDYPSGLTVLADGTLIGTTVELAPDGLAGAGSLFRFAHGRLTKLHDFATAEGGLEPEGPPIQGPSGEIIGSTAFGGSRICHPYGESSIPGCGVIYQYVP